MNPSMMSNDGLSKEMNSNNNSDGNGNKLPVRRCYDQAIFEAEMNDSDIMFTTRGEDNEGLFSAMAMNSKKETMEIPSVATTAGESPPVENPSGTYGSGNFTFVSCEEKNGVPTSSVRKKRKHAAEDELHDEIKTQLYSLLENNSRVLESHIESQNLNSQLDRNQRKEHAENLVSVLSKLADAMEKIADRL